jgi:hypothetical protein
MGDLSVVVLGAPRVRHGDATLAFPTRKALALLTYLAVEGGMHARGKLASNPPGPSCAPGRSRTSEVMSSTATANFSRACHCPRLLQRRDAPALSPRRADAVLHAGSANCWRAGDRGQRNYEVNMTV